MWTDHFKRMQATLEKGDGARAMKQLQEAEQNAPELYAAFNLLSMVLHREMERLDDKPDVRDDDDSIVSLLHPTVIRLALQSPLTLSRELLCAILDRYAARRHFRDLARGVIREPSSGCGDR